MKMVKFKSWKTSNSHGKGHEIPEKSANSVIRQHGFKKYYLLQMLPHFKSWGATGVLVEYEDVFPYREKYEVLRAKNSYRYTVLSKLMLSSVLG